MNVIRRKHNREDVIFYSVKEVALILNCSYPTVRKFINTGRMKAVNFGLPERKRWRVTKEALTQFIEQGGM